MIIGVIYQNSDIGVYWSDACNNYIADDDATIRRAVEAARRTTGANGSTLRHLWENDPEKFGRTLCAGLQAAGRVATDLEPYAVFYGNRGYLEAVLETGRGSVLALNVDVYFRGSRRAR